MATEINVKVPPLPQKPIAQATLPQKPASKASWVMDGPEPDSVKIPEGKPDVLVLIKTQAGYVKAMEIDRAGDSLFGTGPVATEFTEILTEAISQKLSVTCKSGTDGGIEALSKQISIVQGQLDARRRQDDFALTLLIIGLAAAVLCTIVYLVLARLQRPRR